MGNFEDQIHNRKIADEKSLSDSLENISSTVRGKTHYLFSDDKEQIKCVLDEIMKFYKLPLKDIPKDIEDVNEQMEYLFRPLGIMYRKVSLGKGWYKNASGPFLGFLKTGEAVAIIPSKFGFYGYFDPKIQKRVRITGKTQNNLEKDAYCFYKPFPLRKIGIRDLMKYIANCISPITIVYVLLITLFATLIGMLTPRITKILYSTVLEAEVGQLRLLIAIAVFYVSTAISTILIGSMKSIIMNRISIQMDVNVQAATMSRILSLPADFFKDYNSGEITSRAAYINSLCSTIVSTIMSTGLTSLFSLIYISQIFIYAAELVIPAIIITAVTLLFSLISSFVSMKLSKKRAETSAQNYGMTYQVITGVQKIKLSGSEKRVFARWMNLYTKEAELLYNPPKFILFNSVISTAIGLAGTITMYYFTIQSGITLADYTAFNSAYGMLSGAFTSLAGIAITISTIKPIIDMAKPIMDAEPEISEGKQIVTHIDGKIELSNITFRYTEDSNNVIENLSLTINPGQYVAIVGRTGCGKSTLLRLLLGFEKPQKGAIYYDDKDISTLDIKSLRRKIGTVMQNSKLFQADIYSNIIISAPYLSQEDAWKAADIADIADDIKEMPMGMQTIISEGSGGISGGQKQRLMIARAVAPNPRILMLDEATSALDNIAQKKVSNALDALKCTRIVIAHRLSTIKQCDRIIVLDNGHIVEDGKYDELIDKKGIFYDLVERQRLD